MHKIYILTFALFTLAMGCTVEKIELVENVLQTDYIPITVDSVEEVSSSGNFRSFWVHFTPHLEGLSTEQQALITRYIMYENGEERNWYELSRRSFLRSNIPVGTEYTWEMALGTKAHGYTKKSPSFYYKVQ